MSDFEVVRIAAEVVGAAAFLSGGFFWIAKLIYRVIDAQNTHTESIQALKSRQDVMNGSVAEHIKQDEERFDALGRQVERLSGKVEALSGGGFHEHPQSNP